MKEVIITQEMIDAAQLRVDEMPRLNNSITGNTATLHGFVGEEIVCDLSPNFKVMGEYEYDIISDDGLRLEVKTKRTTVAPKPFYEVSVAQFNTHQQCDLYVFTRVLNDLSKGWILGVMGPEEYYANARVLKKGDIDGSNKFVVKSDCWNMRIDDLYQI
jgi:hypothetical protein